VGIQPDQRGIARNRVLIGGLPFEVTNLHTAVDDVIALAESDAGAGTAVRLSNAYCVALASNDPAYRDVIVGEGLTFPDGAPVSWLLRIKTRKPWKTRRVRGPSLFVETLDRGRSCGLRHFMLGGTEDTLTRLTEEVGRRYPGVQIVGTYSPPYGPLDAAFYKECCARITTAKPDVVWVGLGTPKQDFACSELARQLPSVFVGVGAAFDFVAGSVKEAPKWIQNSGMEWAYRLCSEPSRLWRRYLFGNARFIWVVLSGT
jgi:N-acetylglucosaminyldiphosphoundecaprenol N-acetyl-beta-D-mannosaminyltransferase